MSKKALLAIVAMAAAAVLGLSVYNANTDVSQEDNQPVVTEQQEQVDSEGGIEYSEDGRVVTYSGQEGETALEVLRTLTDVETEESDFGEFVTTINGVEADSDKEFWAFYVNGEQATEGAGTYVTSDDDEIEWRLEEIS